jgi:hypothetical protein
MSFDDVEPFEMGEPLDIDEATAEALLSRSGYDADRALADLLGDVRVAFTAPPPAVGPALGELIAGGDPPAVSPASPRRRRHGLAARGTAVAVLALAGTSSLATAGALPGPAQDALARAAAVVGFDLPNRGGGGGADGRDEHRTPRTDPSHDAEVPATAAPEQLPAADDGTEPSTPPAGTHGAEVSAVAHDDAAAGCEHGRAVSAIASGGANVKACPQAGAAGAPTGSTTTTSPATPPTTAAHGPATAPGRDKPPAPAPGASGEPHGNGNGNSGGNGNHGGEAERTHNG